MKTITLHYFAVFREQARCSTETIQTHSPTLSALYDELRVRHSFTLAPEFIRVAVGADYATLDTAVADGTEITFIPPVAGG